MLLEKVFQEISFHHSHGFRQDARHVFVVFLFPWKVRVSTGASIAVHDEFLPNSSVRRAAPFASNGRTAIETRHVKTSLLQFLDRRQTTRAETDDTNFLLAHGLPADSIEHGFKNNAKQMKTTSFLYEKYLKTADKVLDNVIFPREKPKPQVWKLTPENLWGGRDAPVYHDHTHGDALPSRGDAHRYSDSHERRNSALRREASFDSFSLRHRQNRASPISRSASQHDCDSSRRSESRGKSQDRGSAAPMEYYLRRDASGAYPYAALILRNPEKASEQPRRKSARDKT